MKNWKGTGFFRIGVLASGLVLGGAISLFSQEEKVCNSWFHLQSLEVELKKGSSIQDLSQTNVETLTDPRQIDPIHDAMPYTILTSFKSSCDEALQEPRKYAVRPGNEEFKAEDSTDNSLFVRFYDASQFPLSNLDFTTYVAWSEAKESNSLTLIAGKEEGEASYKVHYLFVEVRIDSTTPEGVTIPKISLRNTPAYWNQHDPAQVVEGINLEETENRKVTITTQRVSLSFKPDVGTNISAPKSIADRSGFNVKQLAEGVQIRFHNKQNLGPVYLHDMLGNKITVLHPTGYSYFWNGKLRNGAQAPQGVYFLGDGKTILGKFFFR